MGARTTRGIGDHWPVGRILVGLVERVVAILKDDAPAPVSISSGVDRDEENQGSSAAPDSVGARTSSDYVRLFLTLLLSSLVTSGFTILAIVTALTILIAIFASLVGLDVSAGGIFSFVFDEFVGGWIFEWIILPCLVVFMLPYLIISVYWKMQEQELLDGG